MKILHVLDHSIPLHSGYTFRTRSILLEQGKRGWETVQLTSTKHSFDGPEFEIVDGLRFYRTLARNNFLQKLPILNQVEVINSLACRLEEVVQKERPDILHAHSPSLNALAAIRVGKRNKIPVVYECRAFWEDAAVDHGTISASGIRYRLTRWLETRAFKQVDAVATICEGLKSDILRRGIAPEKVTVIPNAVNLEDFTVSLAKDKELAVRLGIDDKTVIGFIGSFYHYEGLHLLLEAIPFIREIIPNISLLLVGGGPEDDALQRLAKASASGDVIYFTGRVPHAEVQSYYSLIDILVYPRLSMRLTDLVTPLKPLEAMAQGKLVAASDVGGHKELIRDGWNGRLFGAGDVHSIVETIISFLQNRDKWPGYAQNGREYVEQERNWGRSCQPYKSIYERLLK